MSSATESEGSGFHFHGEPLKQRTNEELLEDRKKQIFEQQKCIKELQERLRLADNLIEYIHDAHGYIMEREGRYKTLKTMYDNASNESNYIPKSSASSAQGESK